MTGQLVNLDIDVYNIFGMHRYQSLQLFQTVTNFLNLIIFFKSNDEKVHVKDHARRNSRNRD